MALLVRDVYEWVYSPYGWCSFVSVSNATFDHEQWLEGVYFIKNCPSFSFFLGHPQQQNNLQSTTYCKTPSGDRPLNNNFIRMNLGVPFSTYLSRHPTQARPDLRLYIVYWKVLSALYRFPVSYYYGYYVVHPDPIKPFINITQAKFQTVSLIVEMPS